MRKAKKKTNIEYPYPLKNSPSGSFDVQLEYSPVDSANDYLRGNYVENRKRLKNRKKVKFWKFIFAISLLIFLIAASLLGYLIWSYHSGQAAYDELEQYADVKASTLSDMKIDWDALSKINPDVVGWLYIPDTVISYPIVWKQGDNNYYLHHNFNNKSTQFGAEYGCIFLSGLNSSDFSDSCNFIFGHNMYNGKVFSVFSDNQGKSEWFNEHREVFLLTKTYNYRLQTFCQNKVSGSRDDIAYSSFSSDEAMNNYINERKNTSIVSANPAGADTEKIDKFFAFSTCSSPDSENRIITYASISESVRADETNQSGSYVDSKSVDKLSNDSQDRLN